ncbi:unnamed protein product [Kuraishia capsulata CBS 1993]|uniref:FAD dependent oxidoreductase domain-containing protein n=1 Tax=Kuraishia capsulata CBS 1993 TaxID=1382522 RepID=W6MPP9_9ASCO|nr:uncharacterized protein KUCA_T00003109001 [Kuraishia capsulata CBS 1993]CDK27132.1 unnamed protein product [Kuraishia capsulata CBS 1993]
MPGSVLVVGCGVFGLATSRSLAEKGYSVTAIDAYEPPSPWSAANDYNKIIRGEYTDMIYSKMSVEAIDLWRNDPVFKGLYNECGRLMITPAHHVGRKEFERKGIENLNKLGEGFRMEYFQGGNEVSERFDFFKYNLMANEEESKFNPDSGLAHAGNSLRAVYRKCKQLGVKFLFGKKGEFVSVEKKKGIAYIKTADGSLHTSEQIVVCCGAATGKMLDLQEQQGATGLFVTHIKLTPSEYETYKNMPVLFDAEMGYFFPPDPETRILKIAQPGAGASHFVKNPHNSGKKISLPRYHNLHPTDTMPKHCIKQTKQILAKYIPELAYHELFDSKVCWVADTADSHFIVDGVPGYSNLYVATGDSGHGFKFLPNIGKYIVGMLEGNLDEEYGSQWKWKTSAKGFDPVSMDWRVASEFPDLKNVDWVQEQPKAKL